MVTRFNAAARRWSFCGQQGQQIYLGYVALALAVVGTSRGRRRGETWFWVTSALLFFVLTLGPNLRIAGHDTGIPLPFRLLENCRSSRATATPVGTA